MNGRKRMALGFAENSTGNHRILGMLALVTFLLARSPGFARAPDPVGPPDRPSIAIESVSLVDVERGEILNPRMVLIVDGRIAAIGEPDAISIPTAAVRVDGRGCYLMPGLVDMHVHLFNNASRRPPNEWAFPLFVANGVTGVREMRTEPAQMATVTRWSAKAARGELVAPRVLAAGVAVGVGDAPDTGAATAEAVRRKVREAKATAADFIKIFSEVREAQWRAIFAEARPLGIPVCGHIPAEVGLLEAAIAGQRSNEHLTQVYEACSAREKEWLDARKKGKGHGATEVARNAGERSARKFRSVRLRSDRYGARKESTGAGPYSGAFLLRSSRPPKKLPRRSARALSASGRTNALGTYLQRRISDRGRQTRDPALASFPANREDASCGGRADSGRD
jgi:Amidohydrolase family